MGQLPRPERIRLANTPTPLEYCESFSKKWGREIYLWRDDLTGFLLSGNKVRKLEFLLAEAKRTGADCLVTCGGEQSNHARATAFAAQQLGLACHIVTRLAATPTEVSADDLPEANQFLMRQAGASLHPVAFADYQAAGGYEPFLKDLATKLRAEGRKPYVIPEGGSNALGLWGYIQAVSELADTPGAPWPAAGPDHIVTAVGSGGTLGGLHLGVAQKAWSTKVVGFNVCDSAAFFQKQVGGLVTQALEKWQLTPPTDPLAVIDGYVGEGYAQTTPAEMKFYQDCLKEAQVCLDPVYTGKAFRGLISTLRDKPERLPGRHIVFLHSGGLFANFAFRRNWLG